MERITTHQTKTHLSKFLARVKAGEQFLICRGDAPLAMLIGLNAGATRSQRPQVGTVTSQPIAWSADAFVSLSDEELKDWGL